MGRSLADSFLDKYSLKFLQVKQRAQVVLTLMKNSNNHDILLIFQVENTVVFTWKITILGVYGDQGIERKSGRQEEDERISEMNRIGNRGGIKDGQ